MLKKIATILFCLVSVSAAAGIPVGEWRCHFSYRYATDVTETPNKIFFVADNNLFSVSKEDELIETYSKPDGLSDNSVSRIAYDNNTGKLVIVYTNSNIDVWDSDGNIVNIPDLYKKQLMVDKSVNDIMFYDGNCYLSTNFGIVAVNLKKYEIKDTYIVGDDAKMVPVYSTVAHDGWFYALLGKELKRAKVKGSNLLDYNNWDGTAVKLPDNTSKFTQLKIFENKIIIAAEKGNLYKLDDKWNLIFENNAYDVTLNVSNDNLLVSLTVALLTYNSAWEFSAIEGIANTRAVYVNGTYYIAGLNYGAIKYSGVDKMSQYKPNGPYVGQSQKITFDGKRIVVAPGKSWKNRMWVTGAVNVFEDDHWTSYYSENSGAGAISPDNIFNDVVSAAVDPADGNHIFAATWGEGIYEFRDGKAVNLYNHLNTNGVLKQINDYGPHYVRVDALTFDKSGNLWVANSLETTKGSDNNIACLTPQGEWKEMPGYSPLETCSNVQQIMFHSNKQIWVRSARNDGIIFVKDDNGTPDDPSDDKNVYFKSVKDKDGKTIMLDFIYDMTEDVDGSVWIVTPAGPITFTNCSKIFDSNYTCTRIKIPRNDGTSLADYLLDGIECKAIAIDGGGRKWIGTTNSGVYLISADGQETIANFTTENSPLPNNEITSIAVDDKGEVFIGTSSGIVSYKDGITEPVKKLDKSGIYVYPNPVTPDYSGMITIVGLEKNCVVRITDASGNLVFSGKSEGGSLVWDGKNYHGSYVSTGVYFYHIFNTDENNSRHAIAKVLIIR